MLKRILATTSGGQVRSAFWQAIQALPCTTNAKGSFDSALAFIKEIESETPTVRRLTLDCKEASATPIFKPGQWIDFHIPGMNEIGGFSITSSPQQLADHNTLDLAIKEAGYPPARWVHEQAQGLASAGNEQEADTAAGPGLKATLLYSAASPNEFAFLSKLSQLVASTPSSLSMRLFVTGSSQEAQSSLLAQHCKFLQRRRIAVQDLEAAWTGLRMGCTQEQRPLAFVCGPPGMTEAVNRCLLGLGLDAKDIRFEKWW
ncbi:hypothetical protein WJX74_004621 [Apatococcus lobatus]|uniref:FAD-binding FR-type domain-containing protein n=2 Tax=Apatococcus TaxID=904362 RepID=A0AAW1SN49_9CHLO